jgi:hypothetical protein
MLGVGGTLYFRDHKNGSCQGETSRKSRLASLPRFWAGGTRLSACPISAYAIGQATKTASSATPTFGPLAPQAPAPTPVNTSASTTAGTLAPAGPTLPALPPLTLPPVNTVAPAVSGMAQQGDTLTTSSGTWSGSPTSYAYQWQDCDSSGGSCVSISGATSSSYTLQASDVGSTIRSLVTATNSGGSTSQSSAPTGVVTSGAAPQVGAPTPAGVTCSTTLDAGANVQTAVAGASPGAVVCLNSGSWSAITLTSIAPASPGVTLAAAPGQTVVVPGFTITGTGTKNLTIEGFDITVPATTQTQGGNADNGFQLLCGITGDVTLQYNTIEDQPNGNGIYVFADNCGSGQVQNGVTIEYNQIDHVGTGVEIDGGMAEEQNFTFSHNVVGPYILDQDVRGHYIQIQGISGFTADNNAFEGPADPSYLDCASDGSQSHLNVLHIDGGESNLTFDNNLMWHDQTCGDTVLIQNTPLDNVQIEDNLDIEDPACNNNTANGCQAEFALVEAPHGLTFNNNTSVNAARGITLGYVSSGDSTYTDPQSMTAQNNITAPSPGQTGESNYGLWDCTSSCTTQNNTSADTSANILGGTGNVLNWTPSWTTTNWTPPTGAYTPPPTGYYQPTGLGISAAGYQGSIGP